MQAAGLLAGHRPAELLSNPLFDDPALRLTPRLVLGAPLPAAAAAAPQPGSGRVEVAGASSAAPAARPSVSTHPHGRAPPTPPTEPCADPVPVAPAPTQQAPLGGASSGASGSSQSSAGAPKQGQHDGRQQPPAPLLLLAADGSAASSLHSRAGSLAEGQLAGQAFPGAASLPLTSAAGGPGGLSILYENQAMRMERAELKSELKLISARVSVAARSPAGRSVEWAISCLICPAQRDRWAWHYQCTCTKRLGLLPLHEHHRSSWAERRLLCPSLMFCWAVWLVYAE